MNVISSDLKIVNYSWDTFLKKDTKSLLLKIWAPYVEWHGIDSQQSPIAESSDFCYLNATDLLKSVCATLERFLLLFLFFLSVNFNDFIFFFKMFDF